MTKRKKFTEMEKWKMNNPPQDPNVADSTVIDENKIGVELSDRQNYLLRRGVGSNRPESETLDKMSGKFITTENAEKYAKLRQRLARIYES